MSSSARIDELRRKFDENPRRYFAPLANEYRKAGDFDQAIFICQEYLPQQPGHMSGHIVFGQALFEGKRLPEARTVFETALSLDPENLIALRHLADISRDLGETAAARGWYDRVLQADPRNEEIAGIIASLGAGTAAAAAAPTAEAPAMAPPPSPATPPVQAPAPFVVSASAPTVELSAAAVQEMMRARQGALNPPPVRAPVPELLTLDEAATVEVHTVNDAMTLDGLEQTSHEPAADTPMVMEALGLESNAAPGETAASAPPTLDGLDTVNLEISLPVSPPAGAQSVIATTLEIPVVTTASANDSVADDGLLDLGTFSFGAPDASSAPEPVAASSADQGGDPEFLDFDLPAALAPAPAPEPSIPTLIMEAVVPPAADAMDATVPFVLEAFETVAPAVMDLVAATIPAIMDTVEIAVPKALDIVMETPTVVMAAIRVEPPVDPPVPPPPAAVVAPDPERAVEPKAPAFVTETMAQLYLSQGHRVEAIEIYRQLIDARPHDQDLRDRLEAIERGDRAVEERPATLSAAPVETPKRFVGAGPSIRTVLRELFGVESHASNGNGQSSAAPPGELGSIDILFATESVADALSPLAVAFDGGFVAATGDIDELFAGGGR